MASVKTWIVEGLAVVAVLGLFALSVASSAESPLKGTVLSSDGKPMEGVAVSVRLDGTTNVTTSVYTDRNGSYFLPPLAAPMEAGQYIVRAQAVGFEAGRSSLRLSADGTAEQDFTLKPLKDFSKQMSGVEWDNSLPGDTPEDRRIRRILFVNCTQCHTAGFPLHNRFDAAGWRAIVNFMERSNDEGTGGGRINPYIRAYKEELIEYLARVRGPHSTLTPKPLPRVSGESTQIVVTEYDISPGHLPGYLVVGNGRDWSKGTPSRYESSATHDAIVDLQGYVWLADSKTPERTLGKLDPKTGRVTDYKEVDSKGRVISTHDIIEDKNGNIWFNNNVEGTFDKFDPRTEKFQHFPRPESLPNFGNGLIDFDSKGNLWAGVSGGSLTKKDPRLGIDYAVPDPNRPGGAIKLNPSIGEYTFYAAVAPTMRVYGVGVDANDNVWFTQPGPGRMGVVDSRTGKVDAVPLEKFLNNDDVEYTAKDLEVAGTFEPTDHFGPPWQKGPRRQAADKNGATHWVTLSKAGRIAKIDIRTRKITEYPLPYRYSFPYHLAVDKNHMVWVTAMNTDRVFKFNPLAEKWTEYPLPTLGTDIRYVSVDNRTDPPSIWLAYYQTSKLAHVQFRTAAVTTAAR